MFLTYLLALILHVGTAHTGVMPAATVQPAEGGTLPGKPVPTASEGGGLPG